ncbi:MAG: hypothetical protein KKA64_01895 [Nanoarchaeota archaeon]|nr:hypothetical protein [Nanoarchaeota archaeon]
MSPKEIENIFSTPRNIINQLEKPKPKIQVDFREKNSLIPAELIANGIEIEMKHLPIADYIVNNIAVERKTYNDFLNSIINKRLLRQVEEISQFPSYLLIIEGNKEEIAERNFNKNAIQGFTLSLLLKQKIPVLFTEDYEETAQYLARLAKKQVTPEHSLMHSKKAYNLDEQKQIILEGFPGIGPSTAKKLLKHFKSIKEIINASDEGLKEVIGKKAEIFKKILG